MELSEASGVKAFIFTATAGSLGNFGHHLKLRINRFRILLRSPGVVESSCFETKSIECVCAVDKQTREDRIGALGEADLRKITVKTMADFILNADKFPFVHFDVLRDGPEEMEGNLVLRDRVAPLKCTKVRRGDHLAVSCPIDQLLFGITPYSIAGGQLAVGNVVHVEVQIPKGTPLYPWE